MRDDELSDVFHALAHADRRRMLDLVRERPGGSVKELCRHFDTSRIAVMKHLAVLEKAGLIIAEKHGRTKALYFNAVPIRQIYERWTDEYSGMVAGRLTSLKHRLENPDD